MKMLVDYIFMIIAGFIFATIISVGMFNELDNANSKKEGVQNE